MASSPIGPNNSAASVELRKSLYTGNIRFLLFNDIYLPSPVNGVGGWSSLSTLIHHYRTENSFVCLAGDFLGGHQLSENSYGQLPQQLMNHLKLDYITIGNHEFDYGESILLERISSSRASRPEGKWLSANISMKQGKKQENSDPTRNNQPEEEDIRPLPGTQEFSLDSFYLQRVSSEAQENSPFPQGYLYRENHEFDEKYRNPEEYHRISLGWFGLCTVNTPQLSFPTKDISFHPIEASTERIIGKIKEIEPNPDLLIGLSHLSLEEDKQLLQSFPSISLLLGGHDHIPIFHQESPHSHLFKSGCNGNYLVCIDYTIECEIIQEYPLSLSSSSSSSSSMGGRIISRQLSFIPRWEFIPNHRISPDPVMENIIKQYLKQQEESQEHSKEILFHIEKNIENREKSQFSTALSLRTQGFYGNQQKNPFLRPRERLEMLSSGNSVGISTKFSLVRRAPAVFADLVADSMMFHFSSLIPCDGALINGGFIRGDRDYTANIGETGNSDGNSSMNGADASASSSSDSSSSSSSSGGFSFSDLSMELPFPRQAVVVKISGRGLWVVFNQLFTAYPAAVGYFPHVSGNFRILYDGRPSSSSTGGVGEAAEENFPEFQQWKIQQEIEQSNENPVNPSNQSNNRSFPLPPVDPSSRILGIYLNGSPIQFDTYYSIVITSFMASGGDNITGWTDYGEIIYEQSKEKLSEFVIKYLHRNEISRLLPLSEQRIRTLKG